MQNLDTQPDESPRARLISISEIIERATQSRTEWLIEGIYPLGEIILMVGESHSGKTYVALDQGLAVAYGAPWLGIYDVPCPRPVLYVPTEGLRGIGRRIAETIDYRYSRLPEAPFFVYQDDLDITSRDSLTKLHESAAAIGAGFVIIDVLADVTPGVDENAKEMGDMLARLRSISNKTGVTYLVLHHLGKDRSRGARGHSSLQAVTDIQVVVTDQAVPDGSGGILMTAVRLDNSRSSGGKNRNEDPWGPISVDLRKVRSDAMAPVIAGPWYGSEEGGGDLKPSVVSLLEFLFRFETLAETAETELVKPFGATKKQIADGLGLTLPGAYKKMKKAAELGYIEVDQSDLAYLYRLTEKGRTLVLLQPTETVLKPPAETVPDSGGGPETDTPPPRGVSEFQTPPVSTNSVVGGHRNRGNFKVRAQRGSCPPRGLGVVAAFGTGTVPPFFTLGAQPEAWHEPLRVIRRRWLGAPTFPPEVGSAPVPSASGPFPPWAFGREGPRVTPRR